MVGAVAAVVRAFWPLNITYSIPYHIHGIEQYSSTAVQQYNRDSSTAAFHTTHAERWSADFAVFCLDLIPFCSILQWFGFVLLRSAAVRCYSLENGRYATTWCRFAAVCRIFCIVVTWQTNRCMSTMFTFIIFFRFCITNTAFFRRRTFYFRGLPKSRKHFTFLFTFLIKRKKKINLFFKNIF